jgi:glycosyltransferase involved in cell wall biosynthesis
MNILILTRELSNEPNAMGLRLQKVIDFFQKRNKVLVIYPAQQNEKSQKKKNLWYQGISTNVQKKYLRRIIYRSQITRRLQPIIAEFKPDIIYTQEPVQTSIFRQCPQAIRIFDMLGIVHQESLKGKKSVISIMRSVYFNYLEKTGTRNADIILTVNEAHKQAIRKFTAKPIIVFRDGVDDFFFNQYQTREKDRVLVSFVGSLTKDRLTGILKMVPHIIKKNSHISFIIIGDGPDMHKYRAIVKKAHCESSVHFTGYVQHSRIHEYLRNSDVCFSDDWSYIGFPTKVFEYMAMGKSVLVEDTPAVREIINENKNGILYKTPKDFAEKILMLAGHPDMRKRLGKQARKDAQTKHTWNIREQEFDKIISKLKK